MGVTDTKELDAARFRAISEYAPYGPFVVNPKDGEPLWFNSMAEMADYLIEENSK